VLDSVTAWPRLPMDKDNVVLRMASALSVLSLSSPYLSLVRLHASHSFFVCRAPDTCVRVCMRMLDRLEQRWRAVR
jgi:hypothetical protein